jgi:hypothetical protein
MLLYFIPELFIPATLDPLCFCSHFYTGTKEYFRGIKSCRNERFLGAEVPKNRKSTVWKRVKVSKATDLPPT